MQFLPDTPIHPGEILRKEFLAEYQLSPLKVATDLGINVGRLSEVLDGRGPVTAELALRLSRYFSNSPEYWLNLQTSYDLTIAAQAAESLDAIHPVHAAKLT